MMDYRSLPLWPHQLSAIADTEEFLRNDSSGLGYLVKMPTGSGKTGIMAVLARIIFSDQNFLIVVPCIALKTQLIKQLSKDFWEDKRKMNINAGELPPKEILGLLPSTLAKIRNTYDSNKKYIFICVVNTLFAIKEAAEDGTTDQDYAFMAKGVDYVFFDEGHKEPAYSWAKAVRDLKKKTVLFSATPFRNDLKLFHINKQKGHFHFLTHQQAVDRHIIRDIRFSETAKRSKDLRKYMEGLLPELNAARKALESAGDLAKNVDPVTPKVIIRCRDQESVEQVTRILVSAKEKVLGLHENFKKDTHRHLQSEVPYGREMNLYDFVVHQNKLIEGIDNPNFLILLILDPFDNERAIFQQIGRITRNLEQNKMPDSVVFYPKGAFAMPLEAIWTKFLAFDQKMSERDLFDVSDVIKDLYTSSQLYIRNAIRNLEPISEVDPDTIRVPKRACIREWSSAKKLVESKLREKIVEDLEKKDAIIDLDLRLDDNGYFWAYHEVFMSPYFENVVLDLKSEVVILFVEGNHIFYLDTSGKLSEYLLEMTRPLDSQRLLHMASGARRVNSISLINADLNRAAVRRRTENAFRLSDIASSFNDHNYVPSSVAAKTKGFIDPEVLHRYIGVRSGKVSEYTEQFCELEEYIKWITAIRRFMNGRLTVDPYFNRFARAISPPADLAPISILIDLESDGQTEFEHEKGPFDWIDLASDVDADGRFVITIKLGKDEEKVDYKARVEYNNEKKKYLLECAELASDITYAENGESVIAYLNKNQSFRLVTKKNRAFYVFGAFYSPRLQIGNGRAELDLLSLLIPIVDLKDIKVEKGNNSDLKPSATLWHNQTLFGMIARMGKGYKDEDLLKRYLSFTHLVCDDLGNEIGDFIGLDVDRKRIVIIHAKAHEAKLSASSFQEVCGQATKKLDFLSPFYVTDPVFNISRFDKPWSVANVGTIKKRMLKGGVKGAEFWGLFQELVADPDTQKEVYLFTGSMLDRSLFETELSLDQIKDVRPETIDLVYLLRSTWSAVSHMGASLKVFCY